jgi:hypothetical protein
MGNGELKKQIEKSDVEADERSNGLSKLQEKRNE